MRTLIVDDEPGIRSLAGKILSRAGGVCEMAGTAEEALDRLARERFDVVMLDIRLPGMDGLTMARRIQQRDPDIALVVVTGTRTVEAAVEAMQAGAADYVIKPFGADALLRAFGRAADRRRIRLEAGRIAGLHQAVVERTLEVRVLLSQPAETAQGLVQSYLSTLRLRNDAAASHAERVAGLSRALGVRHGMSDLDLDLLERTAILHDIGKFTLPDALLTRSEPLSDDEIQVVRRHPEFGYDVLRGIPLLSPCAPGVLGQLEHYDATGAPLGLRSTQIPLAARIISVANAYDVMTHPRAYAPVQSSLEAIQEIEACAGTQFDPDVVTNLLAHFGVEAQLDDWPLEAEG
jgi:response regulator RpfG family c-di-GMP phosphodiesterase